MATPIPPSSKNKNAEEGDNISQHGRLLYESLTSYALNDKFTDVSISADNSTKISRCHRLVLSTISKYFEAIFASPRKKKEVQGETMILIPHMSNDTLLLILTFIYTGQVQVPRKQMEQFASSIIQLKVRPMIEKKCEFLSWAYDVSRHSKGKPKELKMCGVRVLLDKETPSTPRLVSAFAAAQIQLTSNTRNSAPGGIQTPSSKCKQPESPLQFWTCDNSRPTTLPLDLTLQELTTAHVEKTIPTTVEQMAKPKMKKDKPVVFSKTSTPESIMETIQGVVRKYAPVDTPNSPMHWKEDVRANIQQGKREGENEDNGNSAKKVKTVTPKLEKGGKAIPIHCLLKSSPRPTATGDSLGDIGDREPPDVDDFLIVPAATPFNDLLPTALKLLGQAKDTQAEGWILLRNWKPLRLEQVSDAPQKTVGDILHDLTNHATLNILITRINKCTAAPEDNLKEKLLRLLLAQAAEPPHGQVTTSNGEELRRRFDIWYSAQHTHTLTSLLHSLTQETSRNHPKVLTHLDNTAQKTEEQKDLNHPLFQGISPQKTRMRTSFDPEMELPRLQDWFAENPHPSRHQIQSFVRELNTLECRKDRKPLDINNVIYWFKNARAAQKRNELRYNGLSPFTQHTNHRATGDPNNNSQSQPLSHNSPPPITSTDNKGMIRTSDIKQEEDSSTSLDVEAHEGEAEPRDLSLETRKSPPKEESGHEEIRREEHFSLADESSSSVSPRSSPPLSPRPELHFPHHHQLLSTFPPIIDHHSFMAYSHHINAFPFSHTHLPIDNHTSNSYAQKRLHFDFSRNSSRQEMSPFALPHFSPIPRKSQSETEQLLSLQRNSEDLRQAAREELRQMSPCGGGNDERRKRNRTFIDPVSEVPRLETWFSINTHPAHSLILKYTEELNRSPYRNKFPKLEPKNVQFWFKNRRAKSKRLKMTL